MGRHDFFWALGSITAKGAGGQGGAKDWKRVRPVVWTRAARRKPFKGRRDGRPMPLPKETLERALARMNEARRPEHQVRLESYEPPGRFVLSFPDRAMPEGQCIDQDFSEVQFGLHEKEGVFTDLRGGRQDEETRRYLIEYEVVEWG